MPQFNPRVYAEPAEAADQLQKLGLSHDIVATVARLVAAAKAEALEVDPANSPGQRAYMMGVRATRLLLLPRGWRMSRAGGVEATVSDALGIQVFYQTVDVACTAEDPRAISGKGSGSRKLIQRGQRELFESEDDSRPPPLGSTPTVWVICVSVDEKRLRAEVSCPEAFEGEQFDGFETRIFCVDEDLEGNSDGRRFPKNDGPNDTYEVQISRK